MNKKDRRHSGWIYSRPTIKGKKEDILNEALEPQPYYDEWNNHRDSFRGYDDHTKKKPLLYWFVNAFNAKRWNRKIKFMLKRRKRRKEHGKSFSK